MRAHASQSEDLSSHIFLRSTLRASHGRWSAPNQYELALTIIAMANGMAMEKLVDPDRVADDLYGWLLVVLFKGLAAEQEAFTR